jgi:hypothetical protein
MKIVRLFVAFTLLWFTLSPRARAVVPAPDGGYPDGNTAEGDDALFSLTNGSSNTAIGFNALFHNTAGDANTATGFRALFFNTTGDHNTATGLQALLRNTTGRANTANGDSAFSGNTMGMFNTANGFAALGSNTTGSSNTASGARSLFSNTIGSNNTANGFDALYRNTTGDGNTANGLRALFSNTTGSRNTATDTRALFNNSTGNGNIALGIDAGSGVTTANDVICIGTAGANVGSSCYIGNIFNQSSPSGVAVFVNSIGKLGTATSSARFKADIKPMGKDSDVLLALKPVSFHYKKEIDPVGISQFGLVAEEVEKVNPDLIVRDKEGKPYSVRYDQVNAMLLNEFLKEHKAFVEEQRKVREQEAIIAQLKKDLQTTAAQQQKQIDALAAGLQRVSAQIEMSKAAPQTALNNQ